MQGQIVVLPKNEEIKLKDMVRGKVTMESEEVMWNGGKKNQQDDRYKPPQKEFTKKAIREGEKDAVKAIVRDKEVNENMLDDALDRAQTVLYHCKSVFPFDFFPNDLIIDLSKVTVVKRNFFMSGSTQSVYMRDIVDVEVATGPFFSSLAVVDMYYAQNKMEINYLKRGEAMKAREIILGVVAAIKLNVNITTLEGDDMLGRIRELALANRAPNP